MTCDILINMPGPIRRRFGYGQRALRIGPDRICRIRFPASSLVPLFQRRPGSYCVKPAARIRSGRPGQVLAKCIWPRSKPVCMNNRARFWLTLPSRSGSDANRIRHVYWEYHMSPYPLNTVYEMDVHVGRQLWTRVVNYTALATA